MKLDNAKQYTTIAALAYLAVQTAYRGWRGYQEAKNNEELYEEISELSAEVHDISKKKSDLSLDEQIETINQARMLVDLSMFGERATADLERGDIKADKPDDVKNYLAVKASTLHRDMHQEIRRRGYNKYTMFRS